jgi:hypothetical protein
MTGKVMGFLGPTPAISLLVSPPLPALYILHVPWAALLPPASSPS